MIYGINIFPEIFVINYEIFIQLSRVTSDHKHQSRSLLMDSAQSLILKYITFRGTTEVLMSSLPFICHLKIHLTMALETQNLLSTFWYVKGNLKKCYRGTFIKNDLFTALFFAEKWNCFGKVHTFFFHVRRTFQFCDFLQNKVAVDSRNHATRFIRHLENIRKWVIEKLSLHWIGIENRPLGN